MSIIGHAGQFWDAVRDIRAAITDDALVAWFARLVDDLPADLFHVEFVKAGQGRRNHRPLYRLAGAFAQCGCYRTWDR